MTSRERKGADEVPSRSLTLAAPKESTAGRRDFRKSFSRLFRFYRRIEGPKFRRSIRLFSWSRSRRKSDPQGGSCGGRPGRAPWGRTVMKPRTWKPGAGLALALAGLGFCAAPHAARAQQPAPPPPPAQSASLDDLEERLRKLEELNAKLEQQNQKLAEQNDKLEKQNQQFQTVAPAAADAPAAVVPP